MAVSINTSVGSNNNDSRPGTPTIQSQHQHHQLAAGTVAHLSNSLKVLFQRLPALLTTLILPAVLLSETFPILFSIYYFLIMMFVFVNSVRTAYAVYAAYHGARYSAVTNWRKRYLIETGMDPLSNAEQSDCFSKHDLSFSAIEHLIILPNYKEDMETLYETLDVLASHSMALTQYKICLAMEQSEMGSEEKAKTLMTKYSSQFLDITFTMHPTGISGEIRGKSSNVAWAARHMAGSAVVENDDKLAKMRHQHQILTIMDADTCFAQDYFTQITYLYCMASTAQRKLMMFAPSTVFDRNAANVPVFVRVADMFWSMGVISNLYDSSPIKIPCSAYSLSMDLAVAADFWDTDAEAMGEDMHMYLKCFFSTQGKVIVKSIFSPASQCNVQAQTYLTCLTSRYTQAKRHLWGSLDFGYALRKTILGAIAPQSERFIKVKNVDDDKKKHSSSSNSGVPLLKLLALFHRLFEAHLLLGQFFGLLIVTSFVRLTGQVLIMCSQGNNAVAPFLTSIGTSPYIMLSKQISGYFQALSLVLNLTMFFYYERYHNFVGFERWALQEQKLLLSSLGPSNFTRKQFSPKSVCLDSVLLQTQRLGKRPHLFSHRSLQSLSPLDWFVVPISGFCFGALPMFHVQLMQLFTNSLEYEVAMKPKPGIGGSASPNILQTKNMDDDDEEDESVAALLSPASSRTAGDEGFYDTDE